MSNVKYTSIAEPILQKASSNPDRLAIIFINSNETEDRITFGQLHKNSCIYANILKESGVRPGDIVIIALRHNLELIYSFWGAIYAGAIPSTFAYKGPLTTSESYIDRVSRMVRYSQAKIVITLPDLVTGLKNSLAHQDCEVLSMSEMTAHQPVNETSSALQFTSGEAIAYLQYTSGTTGMQKGVLLSHRAIINLLQSTSKGLMLTRDDVIVSWLPFYHDFGLFGGFLLPLVTEVPVVLISPFKWLSKPRSFLEAIHKYRGTVSFLPNSGHNHTVRIVPAEKVDGLDLSSLRALVNGAEPVLHKSVETFFKHFSSCGFKGSALASGYGMAENTLSATVSVMGLRSPVDWVNAEEMQVSRRAVPALANEPGSVPHVSSGFPLEGVQLKIIDENRSILPERSVGEITIRSNSLFSGYHKRKDLTEKVLINGWYHTGDLGYIAKGQLFVCGRKKDLIIMGGNNIHPEDVENIAASIPGIYPNGVVAFGIEDEDLGTQKLVIICSLEHFVDENEKQDIERALRKKVFRELEVTIGEVELVKKRWIVKTQSGKITRSMNREKYRKLLSINK